MGKMIQRLQVFTELEDDGTALNINQVAFASSNSVIKAARENVAEISRWSTLVKSDGTPFIQAGVVFWLPCIWDDQPETVRGGGQPRVMGADGVIHQATLAGQVAAVVETPDEGETPAVSEGEVDFTK